MIRRDTAAIVFAGTLALACHPSVAKAPWGSGVDRLPSSHAEVRTLNEGYQRTRSQVLVRSIERPTRAALDYAAYHANFMIADAEPEGGPRSQGTPDLSHPFGGFLEKDTLTGDIRKTPLTEGERGLPLAFAPLVQFLEARKIAGADGLEEVGNAVRAESWGLPGAPGTSTQGISEMFLHVPRAGSPEIWVKVEFQPWFKAFGDLPDQDGDGFPELYGRVRAERVKRTIVEALQGEYMARVLGPSEVKAWANQLSSYWYPSFNTDLIAAGPTWPDDHTEADIQRELGGRVFSAPTVVLRGKPQGKATYDVFLVKTWGDGASPGAPRAPEGRGVLRLPKTRPTPDPQATGEEIKRELATHGEGSWTKWTAQLASFDEMLHRRLRATPAKIKGLVGADGFLFYRHSLEFAVGGDLERQPKGKNPLPIIVEWKKELEAHGVDFLFVPVPTKVEIFPDELDPKFKGLRGQIVNPFARKFLLDLAEQGVEVVDLLPAFLSARTEGESKGDEALYQHQDTHWTDRGLRLAADIVAARIKKYPWYPGLVSHAETFGIRETTFTRLGDLHSRLSEGEKGKYKPETLVAHQVLRSDGAPYDDDPDSPVVVLGDSFTGVYELTDAEHAGVSAHVARGIGYPVDLVMSYGGGPNVRQKLMRRGPEALSTKKVVIWIMTVRDLYDYWENWEPLKTP